MPVTVAQNSKDTVSRLIRKEFDKHSAWYQEPERLHLIKVALDYGLIDEAKSMQADM